MKTATSFAAETRAARGKGGARAIRREGKVPGIVYGKGVEPVTVTLPEKELKLAYQKGGFFNRIVTIELDGKPMTALPKSMEFHPVSDAIEHVDFLKVDENSRIRVMVPVRFLNQDRSVGLKRGGVLNIVRHELELVCVPDKIPTLIEIDIKDFNIGSSIHISHVALPEGVSPAITSRDFTIATIAGRGKDEEEAKSADAATPAAGAAPAKAAAKAAPAKPAAKK
ncbi:MAG: 50S ribosomal protein L25/general stress protein Ctc [Rickettsiales bacterium]|nr:50S ribosomal protein L25/general stress protein Ctc [Rickettsiales bacterium]